ncbi:DsrE/DsrF/TusD sulfur relay family protein [Corallincola platygyrae]|uniref:DsrE/DsrF/TusD sulfur relay family protein n=1 Tax=Corallincola platygyrae TaxID=1193278 RepID=A0ABW4XL82_9GAMM
MQTLLFILNHAPYGNESSYNGLRLATNLKEQHGDEVTIRLFLMSDAVTLALSNQHPAEGYNAGEMLDLAIAQGADVKLCKTCCDARGISELPLIDGAEIGTLIELSAWTLEANKVITF